MSEREAETVGAPAPGWYPDPNGSGNLFYWDGQRWTGAIRSPTTAKPVQASKVGPELEPSRVSLICGGAALAISPFLPWVKVILLGNLSLFQLFEAAGGSAGVAWAAVFGGGAAAVVPFVDRKTLTTRLVGLTVGLLGGLLAVYALVDLRHDLRDAEGLAAIGIGPYVAVAGCVAMVIGSVVLRSDRRTRSVSS